MDQWFTLEDVKNQQKACPLSMGQAEAGRYTFCVNERCMAWTWLVLNNERRAHEVDQPMPEGWAAASEPYEIDGGKFVDIMEKPTHGRCGMVPRNV